MHDEKCHYCGQTKKPLPVELWREKRDKEIPEYIEKELALNGLPGGSLGGYVGSFSLEKDEDFSPETVHASYSIHTTSKLTDRGCPHAVFQDKDLARAVLAAVVFLKAWQGRSTPEVEE